MSVSSGKARRKARFGKAAEFAAMSSAPSIVGYGFSSSRSEGRL
jgi:hypothetical protein